jgi:NADP-dependent 3-hydroxy acid dehydrogenase YdfG
VSVTRTRTEKVALTGRTALVTGAGSGIGKAIATALAKRGMHVWFTGRTAAKLEAAVRDLPPTAAGARTIAADLTHEDSAARLTETIGALDVLVLAAGEYASGAFAETPSGALDALYQANVRANYRLIQRFLPSLIERAGQIVFINSSTGRDARPGVSAFSATNHALRALADSLRAEIETDGVRVLSVFPGRTATPRLAAVYASQGQAYRPELLLQPEDIATAILNALTLPRTAEITDISLRPMLKSY